MFKFLKEKLKSTISRISDQIRGAKEEAKPEEKTEEKPVEEKIGREEEKDWEKEAEEEIKVEEKKEEIKAVKEKPKEKPLEKKPAEEKKKEPEKEIEEEIKPEEKKPEIKKEKKIEEEEIYIREEKAEAEHIREEVVEKKPAVRKKAEEIKKEAPQEELKEEIKEEPLKKGFFGRIKEAIATTKISEQQFESLFYNLELALLESNVAVEAIEKIKYDLKETLVEKPISRARIEATIENSLKKSIYALFDVEKISLVEKIRQKKPFVICFVGINGSGKTTTIAKVAKFLTSKGFSVVLAASDTFRAASIEQLQKHADALGIRMIRHNYGSDPAAVAFDAIAHAKSKGIDAVLIDTAGRQHSNANLMDEMEKIIRVAKPDLKIFVGEAITGNDCVEQAKSFNEAINIDAIILAKADIDEKGGAAVSVSYITKKPIIYLGMGQNYSDLKEFDADIIINSLGLAA